MPEQHLHSLDTADAPCFLSGPELDWKPDYLAQSAWLGHIPFAFWLVQAVRPRCLVELGTAQGASYFAFCQAVERLSLPTVCFAVDNWLGDEHSGLYGPEVFAAVSSYNTEKYKKFSTLLRSSFDDARSYFPAGEIDLLHIDGLHTYEAVAHDFAFWRDALSDRGVLLLHDINVRERRFGVWKLWKELSETYPHLAFPHGSGLGLVAVGRDIPESVRALCALGEDSDRVTAVRGLFAARGEAVEAQFRLSEYAKEVELLGRKETEYEQKMLQQEEAFKTTLAQYNEKMQCIESKYKTIKYDRDSIQYTLAQFYASRSWKLTAPLRFAKRAVRHVLYKRLPRIRQRIRALLRRGRTPAGDGFSVSGAPFVCGRPCNVVWIGGEPDTPGYHYRVIMPALAARAAGVNATYFRLDTLDEHLDSVKAADIVIIWRAAWDGRVAKLFQVARDAGAKVCFDVDDLMFDPRLATVKIIDGIRSQVLDAQSIRKFYGKVRRTMEAADLCIATTPELANHMRGFHVPATVLPNGYDEGKFRLARLAARRWQAQKNDTLLRIGYASGSRTHQRDFALCAGAVVRVLQQFENARLVLFETDDGTSLLNVLEFPDLLALKDRIEWRRMVPVTELPGELARFDVNLAPVEVGNFFCEAKSELKFFEAALAGVCTVASPTAPFARAMRHGETGMLAQDEEQWYEAISSLLANPDKRRDMAKRALLDVLWTFGPQRRIALVDSLLEQIRGGRGAARAFALTLRLAGDTQPVPDIPKADVVFASDRLESADVTVIIPLYNYAAYIEEALDSVAAQTEPVLDLVIVDDASTDASLELAVAWAKAHTDRFNRLLVLKNRQNSKLGPTRNVGFDAAETLYVLPLDADNILLPPCVTTCRSVLEQTGAAYVYPTIATFGSGSALMGSGPYSPHRLIGGNYIDAMALIPKSVWCAVGGYKNVPYGWEDYEFWCCLAEKGLPGQWAGDTVLAKYRVHERSMLRKSTNVAKNAAILNDYITQRHPWLHIISDTVDQSLDAVVDTDLDDD